MFHICFSNPDAWAISYQTGVYGNVFGRFTDKKKTNWVDDSVHMFWGKAGDLVALKPGDRVFFYVIEEGRLYGTFEVADEPYFCQDGLFGGGNQKYPYRFNFNEIRQYTNSVPSIELSGMIQRGEITSIATFERDRNAGFRGIRQLTKEDGEAIDRVLLRYNANTHFRTVKGFSHPRSHRVSLASKLADDVANSRRVVDREQISYDLPIKGVRKFSVEHENALQGHIFSSLRRGMGNIESGINVDNFTEALMEVPLLRAEQDRYDISCLYRRDGREPHFYSIIEIKKNKLIMIEDLSQLIGYMKTFAATKGIPFNSVEGVYISTRFHDDAVRYLQNRRQVENENPIRLVKYAVDGAGLLTFTSVPI